MTQELTIKQKNQFAQKQFNELMKWKNIAGMSYLQIGKILKDFKEQRLYENLGEESPEYESFETFLRMPEINIKLRKAYYLIQIYDLFCDKLKFKPEELSGITWTSLRSLIPVIRPENAKDLLEEAKVLTRNHLDIKIEQLRAGVKSPETCQHTGDVKKVIFYVCDKCKERFKEAPKNCNIIKE